MQTARTFDMALVGNDYGTSGLSERGSSSMAYDREIGWKLLVDIVICLAVATPIAVFRFAVTPFHRGYFCDDDSIRLNFKTGTIHSLLLYFVGAGIPVTAFIVIEFVRFKRGRFPNADREFTIFGYRTHALVVSLLRTIYFFTFACVCSQMMTDVGKYTIGRLRPHFLDVCRSSVPCGTSSIVDPHVYILDYQCTAPPKATKEARLSFPSGHASFSAVTMVYLVLFLHCRLSSRDCRLLRPFLQFLCILLTFYVGLSRVSDNKHHWSDVLAGFVLGSSVAVLVGCFVSDLFPQRKHPTSDMTIIPLTNRAEY